MKKRIRKKKHFGEFTEYGFNAELILRKGLSHEDFDSFIMLFLRTMYEEFRLECGGGGDPEKVNFFLAQFPGPAMEDTRREKALAWMTARPEVEKATAGPLTDAWH